MSQKFNIENNQYHSMDTYRNERIKFNHKRMPQSKLRKKILFIDILFKKLFSTKQNYDIANKKLLIIVATLQY